MCRSIKTLRRPGPPATEDEIRAAALQYVRKISGYRAPSKINQAQFDQAVEQIAAATRDLLAGLAISHSSDPPHPELSPGTGNWELGT
jgi:hypothetical protein